MSTEKLECEYICHNEARAIIYGLKPNLMMSFQDDLMVFFKQKA